MPSPNQNQLPSSHGTKQYHRFYCHELPVAAGMSVELEPEEAKHAVRVLRLLPGDPVELCDGRGGVVLCELAATSKTSALVTATAAPTYVPWRGPQWVVAAACLTLKGGRTDWLVEKATELGAHSLLPLITARSQTGASRDKFKALADKAAGRKRQRPGTAQDDNAGGVGQAGLEGSSSGSEFVASRLQRLAVSATKQCLRSHGLEVRPAVSLEQLLPQLTAAPVSLVAMAGAPPLLQVLQQQWQHAQQQQGEQCTCQGLSSGQQQQQQSPEALQTPPGLIHPWEGRPCYILIGPEGDFTPDEIQQLSAAGVAPVGLGPHRLRTETAAMAALSLAVLFSDSQQAGVTPNQCMSASLCLARNRQAALRSQPQPGSGSMGWLTGLCPARLTPGATSC